ncbi:hypothetical protein CROQUDRAFT_102270 [Cronartium quercuum f. sp. fusiforme G11]|uniref:Uncharacterized protein n=1 Tax=Cronartium quercuum f. sp. fusiforme G11 TaxID=708437 RepID=A0A9P6N4V3_9BASI|nr:hypothetical protein CROQUDRAFT_102270 [Cronartium quercuum f. sp. fusiforme G11]
MAVVAHPYSIKFLSFIVIWFIHLHFVTAELVLPDSREIPSVITSSITHQQTTGKRLKIDLNLPASPEEGDEIHPEFSGTSEAQNQDLGPKKKSLALKTFTKFSKIGDQSVTPTTEGQVDLIPSDKHPKFFRDFFIEEGKLGVGQAGMIFDDLEDWFESMKSEWALQSSGKKQVEDAIPRVIEKILCHLVLPFLGGLKVMYYGSMTKMSTKILMQEGSKYLQDIMTPLRTAKLESIELPIVNFRTTEAIDWSNPDTLLKHLFRGNGGVSHISHALIVYLLSNWSQWASTHEGVIPISHDWNSFQKTCIEVFFQKTGDNIGKSLNDLAKIYHASANSRNPMIQSRPLEIRKGQRRLSNIFTSGIWHNYMREVGQQYSKEFGELDNKMKSFFKELEIALKTEHYKQNNYPRKIENQFKNPKAQKYLKMISNAITIAKDQIAPTFVGFLALKNENQKGTPSLKNLVLHAWAFVQEYFSQWKHLNMKEEDQTGIYIFGKERFSQRFEVQSPKRTMHSLLQEPEKFSVYKFSWYLAQLWYDSVLYQPFDQTSAVPFTVGPLGEGDLRDFYYKSREDAESQHISSHS